MKIKLYRLGNYLSNEDNKKREADDFINDINSSLFDDDIQLDEKVKESDIDLDVVFVETGGAEILFLKIFNELKDNILLLTHQKNNSLPACLEIKTYIVDNNKKPYFVFAPKEDICVRQIVSFVSTFSAKREMDGANLGVLGKPSDWLIASHVDYKKVKDIFNFNLIDIPYEEVKEEIDLHKIDRVPHRRELENKWKGKKEDLLLSFEIYCAIKRIINKYNLKGLTIRCFELLKDYSSTACLALGLLNDEGIVATCEGDIPTLLTMFLIKHINNTSSFQVNLSKMNFDNNNYECLFAHCTCPLNMLANYNLTTHFESLLGVAIQGELSLIDCSIIKINPALDSFFAIPGEIIRNGKESDACRTQVVVRIEEEYVADIFNYEKANHLVIAYGNILYQFYELFDSYYSKYQKTLQMKANEDKH